MDRSGGTTIKSQPDADATKVQMMPVCTSLLVTLIYLHRIENRLSKTYNVVTSALLFSHTKVTSGAVFKYRCLKLCRCHLLRKWLRRQEMKRNPRG